MLWDCASCGCRAIAGGLSFCPHCHKPRPKEGSVPKTTKEGGASNAAAQPGEPGYVEPETKPKSRAAKDEQAASGAQRSAGGRSKDEKD